MTVHAPSNKDVWVFDDFHPGSEIGRLSIPLSGSRLKNWEAIFGPVHASSTVPSGLLVAIMMEAYLKAFPARPPGNIHASQKLVFYTPAQLGDLLEAIVSCTHKITHKNRHWVTFGVSLRNGPDDILYGEIRTIWAK